ncbi:MAG TPA: hypothetical protein VH084_17495 [Mycobacterium sp.]|jgi:hypothetical protein|nr:hypothetical protein [Mycobacterium sp.]
MTDLSLAGPPPAAPAPAKPTQRINWSVLLILAAVIAAGTAALVLMSIGLSHWMAPSPVAPVRSGSACAANAVAAYPNGDDGVSIFVHTPGPDLIQVDVYGAVHGRLRQQVPAGYGGAKFYLRRDWPRGDITVSSKGLGTCTVPAPAADDLISHI